MKKTELGTNVVKEVVTNMTQSTRKPTLPLHSTEFLALDEALPFIKYNSPRPFNIYIYIYSCTL